MAAELRALIRSNTVRVLDLGVLTKDADGSVEANELRDVNDSDVGQLRKLEADLAVLLGGGRHPGERQGDGAWQRRCGAVIRTLARLTGFPAAMPETCGWPGWSVPSR